MEPFSLTAEQSKSANAILYKVVEHYGLEQPGQRGYLPATLIYETFEHVHIHSKDVFLNFFFLYIHECLELDKENPTESDLSLILGYLDELDTFDLDKRNGVQSAIESFADYMVDCFFFPLKASSTKTPQPTPLSLSSIQASTPTGITQRVSILRRDCLIRDHHRCVVSRRFDRKEAQKRIKDSGVGCKDDDGNLLRNESGELEFLEVAHILPHSLATISPGDTELSESKKGVLQILAMFEPSIGHLVEGPNIDSPKNALTLMHHYHRLFGDFEIYFEQIEGRYNEYMIKSTERDPILRDRLLPVSRTLTLSPNLTIDPPSSKLLGVHRAIALILKLSGAGEYIEKILRDMEEESVKEDGSTNLGTYSTYKLEVG